MIHRRIATVVTGKGHGTIFSAVGKCLDQLIAEGKVKSYKIKRNAAFTFTLTAALVSTQQVSFSSAVVTTAKLHICG